MKRDRIIAVARLQSAVVIAFFALTPLPAGGSWTQWGGPDRDFTVDATGLASSWPEEGPRRLWEREFGEGYSSLLFEDGRLYTMARHGDDEVVLALDAETGRTLWKRSYAAPYHESQTQQFGGGPNATPLIVGDRLVTIGFTSVLHCLDKRDGSVLWSHDLIEKFDGQTLEFGYSSSPLVHDGRIVVLLGGRKHAALGFDPENGSVVWKAAPLDISYGSSLVIDVDGQDQLVFMTPTEVVGIGLDSGSVAWRYPHENQYETNCAGPWWGEDDLLFVSSQGEAGSRTLKLTGREGITTVQEVARDKEMKVFHNSLVRLGDWVYAGSHDSLAAYNIRKGETAWKEKGFTEANVLLADGKAILLDEEGRLALATLTPEALVLHSSVQLLDKPAWTPPTLVGTRLYLRDKHRLLALDLAAPVAGEPLAP
jgi:outer membrane protein assembly factor BamB